MTQIVYTDVLFLQSWENCRHNILSRKFDAYALALVSSFSIRAVSCVKVFKGGLLENKVKILLVLVILTFD